MIRKSVLVMMVISLSAGASFRAAAYEALHSPFDNGIGVSLIGTAIDADAWNSIHDGGDCNDTNPDVFPQRPEVVGNFLDDDCDGLADEDADNNPSNDTVDRDADGITLQAHDCDDTNPSVNPNRPEVFGNLFDDNCNGIADEDALGNPSPDVIDHDSDGVTIGFDRIFDSDFEL